jgi:hypothetical protein
MGISGTLQPGGARSVAGTSTTLDDIAELVITTLCAASIFAGACSAVLLLGLDPSLCLPAGAATQLALLARIDARRRGRPAGLPMQILVRRVRPVRPLPYRPLILQRNWLV